MMKYIKLLVSCIAIIFLFGFIVNPVLAAEQKVYDDAGLLTEEEAEELTSLAVELGAESESEIIIATYSNSTDIEVYKDQFAKDNGYWDSKSTFILTLNMQERDILVTAIGEPEAYGLSALDQIRDNITPYLSDGDYYGAFETFLYEVSDLMATEPHPVQESPNGDYVGYPDTEYGGSVSASDDIFFQWWFQLLISLVAGGAFVGFLLINAGGRITVSGRTYMDNQTSRILDQRDHYVRKTVTKRRKPQNNNNSGGGFSGGGGSFGGGGTSSRGKF